MKISISIPDKEAILANGYSITIARKGEPWKKNCLGRYANLSGVYIHHNKKEIIYIGQTVKGKWGTFGERLRREFQETSSQASSLYRLLEQQADYVKTVCFDLDEIDQLIDHNSLKLSKENKALIFEQLLIGIYQPQGNKHGTFKKTEVDAEATTSVF